MALRKAYSLTLGETGVKALFKPFENGLDNGTVVLFDKEGNKLSLTYNDIAHLYGTTFPEKSYKCVDGVGVEIPNFATLTEAEREIMYEKYPELRPGYSECFPKDYVPAQG